MDIGGESMKPVFLQLNRKGEYTGKQKEIPFINDCYVASEYEDSKKDYYCIGVQTDAEVEAVVATGSFGYERIFKQIPNDENLWYAPPQYEYDTIYNEYTLGIPAFGRNQCVCLQLRV